MSVLGFGVAEIGFGQMHGWGWGMGMGIVGLLLVLLLVGLITWLIVATTQSRGAQAGGARRALDVLDERYARGEIDRDEYLERRRDLEDRN